MSFQSVEVLQTHHIVMSLWTQPLIAVVVPVRALVHRDSPQALVANVVFVVHGHECRTPFSCTHSFLGVGLGFCHAQSYRHLPVEPTSGEITEPPVSPSGIDSAAERLNNPTNGTELGIAASLASEIIEPPRQARPYMYLEGAVPGEFGSLGSE